MAGYSTQDIRFAAFLKVKGNMLSEVRNGNGPGKRFCTFVFDITQQAAQDLWKMFQNRCEERKVDAYELLEEYENLKTQRHKLR